MKATDLVRQDHREVDALFARFQQTPESNGRQRQEIIDQIAEELEVHAKMEEELLYPALQRVSGMVREAQQEHQQIRTLIGEAEGQDPSSAGFAAKVMELQAAVQHHVHEEEGAMFRDAEKLGQTELERLGQQMHDRKRTLKESLIQRGIRGMKLAAQKIA